MSIPVVLLTASASALTMPSWAALKTNGPHVSGHVTAVDDRRRVICFGGLTGSVGSPCTNELWMFEDDCWRSIETADGPGPRMYAAGACLGNSFYLFGGWDPEAPGSGGTFKDEVWRLDLSSFVWEQRAPLPWPVSRHTACTVGGQIVLHTFRGVYVLDSESDTLTTVKTSGEEPNGVSMSAVCALDDHTMLLFGGSTKAQEMNADTRLLDTTTWTWRKLRVEGDEVPSPRASSCVASVGDGISAVVFGGAGLGGEGYKGGAGLTAFDETWRVLVDGTTAYWRRVQTDAEPSARVAASLDPLTSGSFLLQGGWHPKSEATYDRPYVLSLV